VRPARTWAHGVVGMVHLAGARWARQPDVPREEFISDLVALAARGMTGAAAGASESGVTDIHVVADLF